MPESVWARKARVVEVGWVEATSVGRVGSIWVGADSGWLPWI